MGTLKEEWVGDDTGYERVDGLAELIS